MNLFLRGLLLLSTTILFISCKDDDSILGENLLSNKLGIDTDTISNVTTKSEFYPDTAKVQSGATIASIGVYNDEIFGRHKASTIFNMIPVANQADTGTAPQADSLVLQLAFSGTYYGTDTTPQTFKAYRVNSDISVIDNTPLSDNQHIGYYYDSTNTIGSATFGPRKDDASRVLRIKLDSIIAAEFVNNFYKIESDSIFKDFFKGIFIKSETPGAGAICSFSYTDIDSYLRLYFSNNSSDPDESLSFDFKLVDENNIHATSRYNFFDHNYTYDNSEISAYIDNNSFNEGDDKAFLQAMRGINMTIDVDMSASNLLNKPTEDIVINRAILELKTIQKETEEGATLPPPENITVMELNDNDETEHIIDYYLPAQDLSLPQSYSSDDESYKIVLSGFTHKKLNNNNNAFKFWIKASQGSISANRAIFHGSGAADSLKPKLIINYSYSENTTNN